jgi:hypothetical protein
MRITLLIIGFLFFNSICIAQKVKIIDQSNTTFKPYDGKKDFYYIDNPSDTTMYNYVGKIQCTYSNKMDLEVAYNYIVYQSKRLGANSCSLISFNKKWSTNSLTVAIYYATSAGIKNSLNSDISNEAKYYCYGNGNFDSIRFEINNVKQTVSQSSILKYPLMEDSTISMKILNVEQVNTKYLKNTPRQYFIVCLKTNKHLVNQSTIIKGKQQGQILFGTLAGSVIGYTIASLTNKDASNQSSYFPRKTPINNKLVYTTVGSLLGSILSATITVNNKIKYPTNFIKKIDSGYGRLLCKIFNTQL